MDEARELLEAILEGDDEIAVRAAKEIIEKGADIPPIIEKMTETMRYLGKQFEEFEIYLPEMMVSANAMIAAMEIFEPLLYQDGEGGGKGTIVIGSAPGDMHEIGKNIVATVLKADGFNVVDLGKNVSPEEFYNKAKDENAGIIGISALMTTTMPGAKAVIDYLTTMNFRENIKVMIGGAPTTQKWAEDIGADGWSANAAGAVETANYLLGLEKP